MQNVCCASLLWVCKDYATTLALLIALSNLKIAYSRAKNVQVNVLSTNLTVLSTQQQTCHQRDSQTLPSSEKSIIWKNPNFILETVSILFATVKIMNLEVITGKILLY